jgi:hypothetical protein
MPMEEWQEAPPSNGHSMDKSVRKNWKKCLEILPIIVFFFAVPPENTENRIFAQGGGLVLLNVSDSAEGIWTCQIRTNADGGQPLTLAEYALDVDGGWTNKWHNKLRISPCFTEDCAKPKSVEQFHAVQREWCRRMDAYRSNLSKWQNLYESGPDSGGDGWNCPREKQLSTAAEDQQKKPTNIR